MQTDISPFLRKLTWQLWSIFLCTAKDFQRVEHHCIQRECAKYTACSFANFWISFPSVSHYTVSQVQHMYGISNSTLIVYNFYKNEYIEEILLNIINNFFSIKRIQQYLTNVCIFISKNIMSNINRSFEKNHFRKKLDMPYRKWHWRVNNFTLYF